MEVCELLTIEARLDRIEAELAAELPPHLRAFARAHARGQPAPPAPDALQRPATLATARAALVHPLLADRGLALLRLAAPVAVEADPAVAAARTAPPTWAGLSALAAARDAAAMARFGRRAIDVLHRLHGSAVDLASLAEARSPGASTRDAGAANAGRLVASEPGARRDPIAPPPLAAAQRGASGAGGHSDVAPGEAAHAVGDAAEPPGGGDAARTGSPPGEALGLPPAVPGWFEPDGVAVDDHAIVRAWDQLRARHGVAGALRHERVAGARPRAFVVEPGREVVLAVPADVTTPAARFAVLHELGHAVAALALPAVLPRVVDEAAAAYVARAIERDEDPWHSPLAGAARARRRRLAQVLDRIERALPAPPPVPAISERPPWALWHDPGAQASYVAAEWLAGAIERSIGATPAPGALAAALTAWSAPIDRLGTATYAI
ncbi:MAG TPA: hypothetical protein VHT91_47975 [Kofleriaceae bacterium]|jgi:hypothetical protein|nr:hypothetical protein [Kofleriaceae bacterium]